MNFVNFCDVNKLIFDPSNFTQQAVHASLDEIVRNLMCSSDTRNPTLRTSDGNQRNEQVDDEIFAFRV